MERKEAVSSSWVRKNCIGKGSFGTVSLAVERSNNNRRGVVFAVKSVSLTNGHPSHVESLKNEIQILQSLSNPHVVKYLGDDVTRESCRTEVYQNLHLEYMSGGTVADLGKNKNFDEEIVRSYTRCIVSALNYVHSNGIVHCDVKGKNVLVGSTHGVAKLADFGSAKRVVTTNEGDDALPQGTPLWMAPEVIRQERQGPESDVWSLGCTVIEMVTGRPPWKDCDATMVFRIGFADLLPEFPAQLSELGHDFLEKCLRRDPSQRWTCEQLLQHPFLSKGILTEPSPRGVLDWPSSDFLDDNVEDDEDNELKLNSTCQINSIAGSENLLVSARNRIGNLVSSCRVPSWESDGWEVVRSVTVPQETEVSSSCNRAETEEGIERTNSEFSSLVGTVEEDNVGTSSEYLDLSKPNEGIEITRVKSEYSSCAGRVTWVAFGCGGCKAGLDYYCQHGLTKYYEIFSLLLAMLLIRCKIIQFFVFRFHLLFSSPILNKHFIKFLTLPNYIYVLFITTRL